MLTETDRSTNILTIQGWTGAKTWPGVCPWSAHPAQDKAFIYEFLPQLFNATFEFPGMFLFMMLKA